MSKNKYEIEIDDQINEIKRHLKNCIAVYKENTNLLISNFENHGTIPLDCDINSHKNLFNNFQIYVHRLDVLEGLKRSIKLKKVRSSRGKSHLLEE